MDVVWTVVGAVLIAFTLRDVFDTLWHPSKHGILSTQVGRLLWRWAHRLRRWPSAGSLVGPLLLAVVLVIWAATVAFGWALIYLPHLPEGFVYGSPASYTGGNRLAEAVYVSIVALATLGLGDVTPRGEILRLLTGLQALVGFALLSGAVTWVLQIAPTLTQRRNLAMRLAVLRRADAGQDTGPGAGEARGAGEAAILRDLALGLETVLVGLLQHPETYYFRETVSRLSLAASLPVVEDLLDRARATGTPDVRHAAAELEVALRMLTDHLGKTYLRRTGDVGDILRAVAADHGEPYGGTG